MRLMFNEETFSGTSPFIFHEGMTLEQVSGPSVSEDFFRQCMNTGRINPYAQAVFNELFEYGFLNRRMLSVLLGKSPKSIKDCLNRLVKYGFIKRCYFAFPSGNTPGFYALAPSVREILAKNHVGAVTNIPIMDAPHALRILAINQFVIGTLGYSQYVYATWKNFKIAFENYAFKPGYAVTVRSTTGDVSFVPIVIRRTNEWDKEAIMKLKVFFGAPKEPPCSIPVCICEDLVHVRQLREAIATEDKIKDLTVLYSTDVALADGNIFSKLIIHEKTSAEGDVTLASAEFNLLPSAEKTDDVNRDGWE